MEKSSKNGKRTGRRKAKLEEHNIESSMSRKGNPYDNACTESFFVTLKKEWIYHRRYQDQKDLDEYIELFYNRKRLRVHSTKALLVHWVAQADCK